MRAPLTCNFFSTIFSWSLLPESFSAWPCCPAASCAASCDATSMSLMTTAIFQAPCLGLADLRAGAELSTGSNVSVHTRVCAQAGRTQINQQSRLQQPWILNSIGRGNRLPATAEVAAAAPNTDASATAGSGATAGLVRRHALKIRIGGRFRNRLGACRGSAPESHRRRNVLLVKFEFRDFLLGQRNGHAGT